MTKLANGLSSHLSYSIIQLVTLICAIYFFVKIGKETVLDLAKRGARLILLCRNVDKAKKAAEDIKKQVKEAQISIHQLDLASLKSVRNCAQTLIDTEDRIDILVNNAGNFSLELKSLLRFADNALILAF